MRNIHGWSRVAHWLLILLVYTVFYPPCLVWNLITLPFWFRTYRGLRWYHFTSSGAVEWLGETWLLGKLSKLECILERRILYGKHYKA
jgi:hypothetical protein